MGKKKPVSDNLEFPNRSVSLFRQQQSRFSGFSGVGLFFTGLFFILVTLSSFALPPRAVIIRTAGNGNAVVIRSFQVRIGILRTSLDKRNATFLVVDGLSGDGVSFQWEKSPNYFLIVDGDSITLSYKKHSNWFQKMASFKIHENSDGTTQIASIGRPGFMLATSGSGLVLSSTGGRVAVFTLLSPEGQPQSVPAEQASPVRETIAHTISKPVETPSKTINPDSGERDQPDKSESASSWVMNVLSTQVKAIKTLLNAKPEEKAGGKREEVGESGKTERVNYKKNTKQNKNTIDTPVPAVYKLPEPGNMEALNDFVDTGAITTTVNLLKQLYGKLTPEQEATLEKQFAQYYEYPCDEVKKYFKNLNQRLFKLVALKTRLSVEMDGYGFAAAEATNALAFKSKKMAETASRHLLQRRKNILAIQRQLSEINMHLHKIGTPPNALELKKKHEKYFEDLVRLAAKENVFGSQSEGATSIDGVWEIREDDRVSDLACLVDFNSGKNTLKYKKEKFKDISENERIFMGPFAANKIYLKKVRDIGNGLSYLYVHLYNYYRYGAAINTDDTSNELIMKQVGDSKYVIFWNANHSVADPTKFTIEVKGKTLNFVYENYPLISSNGKGYAYRKSYIYHLVEHPKRPLFHQDVQYQNWDEYEKDIFDGIREYTRLSKQEKETPFSQLPDYEDDCGMIREKIAMFRSLEAHYKKGSSLFKGPLLASLKEDKLIWKLEDVKILDRDVNAYKDRKSGNGTWYSSHYEIASSKSSGWIKIWKIEEKREEYFLNKKTRTKVATFTWQPPSRFFKQGDQWHINMKSSGIARTSWMPMLSSGTESETAEFNRNVITMSPDVLAEGDGEIRLKGVVDGRSSVTVRYRFSFVSGGTETLIPEEQVKSNEPVFLDASKEDFYKLQIQELTEKIAAYKEDMAKATTTEAKERLKWNILGREAELQQQKDFLAQLKTGNFYHTETRWDKANAEISEKRFLEESRVYQKKIHESEYRMDMIRKIGEMSKKMIGQGALGVRNWANRQRAQALKTEDNKKLAEIYDAVKKRYRQNTEQGITDAGQDIAFWDDVIEGTTYVKDKADTAFMIASTIQSGGTMYLYAAYTGLTNGISDGIMSGVEHGLKNINMATMVAGSAYDGYNQIDVKTGKKSGLKGAAKNTAVTLAILGVCHVGIKAAVKTCSVAQKTYSKYAYESALTAQEREMSIKMVRQYESKLLKIEKMAQRGEKAAAKEQAALLEAETRKLMANPHAKNYLKYNGSKITQQAYIHYEEKIQKKVIDKFLKRMELKGWNKFEVQNFRNKASLGSVGMDWDVGLVEDNLKSKVINGKVVKINGKEIKVIMKNGKEMTIKQFETEAKKEFGKVYKEVTGYTAEGSFANFTTSADNEAFRDVAILTDPSKASKKLAESTAETVKYKADFMVGRHSRGFITKAGKYGEACRGMAKEVRTKIIPNLRQSSNKLYLQDRIAYMNQLHQILQNFGENKIGMAQAEQQVRKLTGKSLNELPEYISSSLEKTIKSK